MTEKEPWSIDGQDVIWGGRGCPAREEVKLFFSYWRGCDESGGFGHAVTGDQWPSKLERFFEKRFFEVFASYEGKAKVLRAGEVACNEVKDLGGDEGREGDFLFLKPVVKEGRIPLLIEFGKAPAC